MKIRISFDDAKAVSPKIPDHLLKRFVEWKRYITVEFDTDKGTCRVVPVSELQDGDAHRQPASECALSEEDAAEAEHREDRDRDDGAYKEEEPDEEITAPT